MLRIPKSKHLSTIYYYIRLQVEQVSCLILRYSLINYCSSSYILNVHFNFLVCLRFVSPRPNIFSLFTILFLVELSLLVVPWFGSHSRLVESI
jgi:hypothetical protein